MLTDDTVPYIRRAYLVRRLVLLRLMDPIATWGFLPSVEELQNW